MSVPEDGGAKEDVDDGDEDVEEGEDEDETSQMTFNEHETTSEKILERRRKIRRNEINLDSS